MVYLVGKKNAAEPWVSEGCKEYEKRLQNTFGISTTFLNSDDALIAAGAASKGAVFALDSLGKEYTSEKFADVVYDAYESNGKRLTFLIGGAYGLPDSVRSTYPLLSLGKMTWTHQCARLLLYEQLYRAAELRKGSSYHK